MVLALMQRGSGCWCAFSSVHWCICCSFDNVWGLSRVLVWLWVCAASISHWVPDVSCMCVAVTCSFVRFLLHDKDQAVRMETLKLLQSLPFVLQSCRQCRGSNVCRQQFVEQLFVRQLFDGQHACCDPCIVALLSCERIFRCWYMKHVAMCNVCSMMSVVCDGLAVGAMHLLSCMVLIILVSLAFTVYICCFFFHFWANRVHLFMVIVYLPDCKSTQRVKAANRRTLWRSVCSALSECAVGRGVSIALLLHHVSSHGSSF